MNQIAFPHGISIEAYLQWYQEHKEEAENMTLEEAIHQAKLDVLKE